MSKDRGQKPGTAPSQTSATRSRRRPVFIGCTAVVLTAAVAATAFGISRSGRAEEEPVAKPPVTAPVTRQNLASVFSAGGDLGYGEETKLGSSGGGGPESGGGGTVTWLPQVGDTVDRGQQIFRIDDLPTVLLFGDLPFYRDLAVGAKGPDVRQLEENLAALGYGGFTVDEKFTDSTAKAVKAWQKDLGREKTGTVTTAEVLVVPGAVRVSEQTVRTGAAAGDELVTVTGVERAVTSVLDIGDADKAVVGGPVTVILPDGTELPGTVVTVGPPVTETDPNGMPGSKKTSVTITVHVDDPAALGDLDSTSVDIEISSDARTDVLTVPVSALLALAEGGFGVEVVDGATTRLVPVSTGMFASGRVEVTGDVAEGDLVVVTS